MYGGTSKGKCILQGRAQNAALDLGALREERMSLGMNENVCAKI